MTQPAFPQTMAALEALLDISTEHDQTSPLRVFKRARLGRAMQIQAAKVRFEIAREQLETLQSERAKTAAEYYVEHYSDPS